MLKIFFLIDSLSKQLNTNNGVVVAFLDMWIKMLTYSSHLLNFRNFYYNHKFSSVTIQNWKKMMIEFLMYVGLCASPRDSAPVSTVTVLLRFWFCAGFGYVLVLCRFSDRFILSRTVPAFFFFLFFLIYRYHLKKRNIFNNIQKN